MNILMIGPSRNLQGGVATVVNNYFNSDLAIDFNITYVSTVEKNGKIHKIKSAVRAYVIVIYNILFKKIDIVHIHLASRGSFYRKRFIISLTKIFNKKVIVHLHGAEFNEFYHIESNSKQREKISKTLNKADIVIALSNKWKCDLEKITNSKIIILHNSVKCSDKNLYNTNSKNIIFLGRLDKRKGALDIIEISKNIFNKFPNYKLLLCGDGDIDQIKNLIDRKNISENIKVLGWISGVEKERIMKDAVINLLPSYNEGLPMSILEAMGHGIPTIASNVGGIPDVIEENINGFLVNPGDKKMLEERISEILLNENIRNSISEQSFKKIYEKFNIDNNILQLKNIYKSLIEDIRV